MSNIVGYCVSEQMIRLMYKSGIFRWAMESVGSQVIRLMCKGGVFKWVVDLVKVSRRSL